MMSNITKSHNQKTMISLITSLAALVISILTTFFLSPYIVANFGEEANGFTQLANNFVNYAALITVALNSMAGRFITISYYKNDFEKCDRYYSSVIIGNCFIFGLFTILATYFIIHLEQIINIKTANVYHVKMLFSFVFLYFFVTQVNSILGISFYVKNSQYFQNLLNAVNCLLKAVGLLFLFSFFTPTIYFVSMISLVIALMTVPCYFYGKRKLLPEVKFGRKYFDIKAIKTMVSSGLWNTVNQCGNLLMTGFDLLLSNLFIGPVQMGVLSVAKTVPNCIVQLGATVNSSFSPNLTIAYTSGDTKKILSSLRYSMKCSTLLMAIPITVLMVFGSSFYRLWVPSMNGSELTVLSFLTCMAFVPFSGPQTLYNVYTTTNKLKVNSIAVVTGGLINVVLVLVLLKTTNLGLFAVAGASSLISIVRDTVITVPYSAKILGLKWYTFYKDVGTSVLCCLLSGAICYIISLAVPTGTWFGLICAVGISCVLSALSLFALLLNREEKKNLTAKFFKKTDN